MANLDTEHKRALQAVQDADNTALSAGVKVEQLAVASAADPAKKADYDAAQTAWDAAKKLAVVARQAELVARGAKNLAAMRGEVDGADAATDFTLSKATVSLAVGADEYVTLAPVPADGDLGAIAPSSSAPALVSVSTVNSDGTHQVHIRAIGAGSAVVTVAAAGKQHTINVTVTAAP